MPDSSQLATPRPPATPAAHTTRREPALAEAVALAALLMLYSNGLTVWAQRRAGGPEVERVFRNANPVLLGLLFLYARLRPGMWRAAGFKREGLRKSLGWGVVGGVGLSAPALLFFARPVLLDTPLEFGPVARMTRRGLLVELFFRVPTGVAILEETAFRGLLYGILRRAVPFSWAAAGSSAAFGGWHIAVTIATSAQTNLSDARLPEALRPHRQALTIAGGVLTTAFAGAIFALIRERTGNLAGSVMAHWIVDALMIAGLWLGRRGPADSQ